MRTFKQAARFCVSGGICFFIDFGLFLLLSQKISYLAASAAAFMTASATNYILTTKFVFNANCNF